MPNQNQRKNIFFCLKHRFIISLFLFLVLFLNSNAKNSISGQLNIDTTWARIVYLSIIPSFYELNSMSGNMIIDGSVLDETGYFSFNTEYFPPAKNMYRIHLSKNGDPPASLIIGGKDENHIFFIANKESSISISSNDSTALFGNIKIENSTQSQLLKEIDKMVLFVDTANFNSSSLKRELMENALDEKLRQFADTCTYPLVALYAIYKTNFELHIKTNPNFYNRFLGKWSIESSPYFEEFRKNIPIENKKRNYSFIYGIVGLFLGIILTFFISKRKSRKLNLLQVLTIQERKIFSLLHIGKSNKEISDELNISLSTVKSHVNNIFSKLSIKSRKEIINIENS